MTASGEPKYLIIKKALVRELRAGNYLPGHSFITERELCRSFGVSRITAARAINELVSDGLLVRRQGSGTFVAGPPTPEPSAAGDLVACLFHEIHGQHVMEMLAGIEKGCAESGSNLVLFDSALQPEREAANLRRALQLGVKGIIVYPVEGFGNVAAFEQLTVPTVLIDRYYPSVASDAVLPDSFAAAYDATTLMLRAGHGQFPLVWGEVNTTSVQDGVAGYSRALLDAGLDIATDLAVVRPYDSLSQRSRQAIIQSWLARDEPPTAFAAGNAYTLSVLLGDLATSGVQPSDVALCCFSNDNPDTLAAVGATYVEMPSRQVGEVAIQRLIARIRGDRRSPARTFLPVRAVASPALQVKA